MGIRESHAPGTFSWVELATSDADAAKRFYSELFGWTYDDAPVGDGMVYSMAAIDGRHVAALYTTEDQPPHWNSYVTVESADEAARRAADAGGAVIAEPFDVMTAGRMAVVADPTGAAVCVWEPRDNIGAQLVNVPGALTWNDLATTDVATASAFYAAVFGWTMVEIPGAPGDRVVITNGERSNGGMAKLPEEVAGVPPHWQAFFAVEEAAATGEAIAAAGGRVMVGPLAVPAGHLVIATDPQGAVFGVTSGTFDD
jgi:uncharacterized protein